MARAHVRQALLLALAAFAVYNANLRIVGAGDTYPARALPFAILEHGSLYLDPIADLVRHGNPKPYWMLPSHHGRQASLYPIATPVLVTPLYIPVVLGLHWSGASDDMRVDAMLWMEKLVASAIAATAVAWVYLLALRRASRRVAFAVALAFAFGTNTWATSSQALWQHGMAELLAVALLWFATSLPSRRHLWAAGLCCGLLAANRPPDALLALPLAVFMLWRDGWRAAVPLAAGAILPIGLTVAYNEIVFNSLAGGYSLVFGGPLPFLHRSAVAPGLAGLLLSPGKGLLTFSPFLLVAMLGARRWWSRVGPHERLDLACAAAIVMQLALYAGTDWRAGVSFGPRFLTDSLPLWCWLLVPVIEGSGRLVRAAFWVGTSFAVVVQAEGAFYYTGLSDVYMQSEVATSSFAGAWNTRYMPLRVERTQGLAARNLPGIPQHPLDEWVRAAENR